MHVGSGRPRPFSFKPISEFSSDNFLVLAVEKKDKIDLNFIKNFELISTKLLNLEPVSQVFSFIDAPILFLNNTSLTNLNSNNIILIRFSS